MFLCESESCDSLTTGFRRNKLIFPAFSANNLIESKCAGSHRSNETPDFSRRSVALKWVWAVVNRTWVLARTS